MKFINSILLVVIGLVGLSCAQDIYLLDYPLELLDGALGVAASVVGMQPLIDYCKKGAIASNGTLYAAVTYTNNPGVIVPFVYGECAPYDVFDEEGDYAGSMEFVYFCKPGWCNTYRGYNCPAGQFGNIGPIPLLLPAGFFLPNYIDVIDFLGLAAICQPNALGL